MPTREKQTHFWNFAITRKSRARCLLQSFGCNLNSEHSAKTTFTLFIYLVVFLGLIPVISAQSQKPADECQDIQKHIKKEQDRFKGTTTIRLDEMMLSERPGERLTLQIEVSFSTEKETKPKDVKLVFKSQAPRLRLYQGQEAIFLADGNRIRSITATDDTPDQFGMSTRFEKKNVVVGYEDFAKIANAESVEMQLGAVETKFDQKVTKALRNFVLCALKTQHN